MDSDLVTAQDLKNIERAGFTALKRIYDRFRPQVMEIRRAGALPKKIAMIAELQLDTANKSVGIRFNPDFIEHFYKMWGPENTHTFNKHKIRYVTAMKCNHAQRIYRMLNSQIWKDKKVFEISIEDLKYALDIENKSSYKKMVNLKARVIDESIEKINELTNITASYENIKNGRTIVGFRFKFDYSDDYKRENFYAEVKKLQLKYLKNAIPFSIDGSHFKDEERKNYIVKLNQLSSKQIRFLVQCPEFLNDYSIFYSGGMSNDAIDTKTAQSILTELLKSKLDMVQEFKIIDFDYYAFLQAQKGIFTKEELEVQNQSQKQKDLELDGTD